MSVSTHVLDAAKGVPAAGVPITLTDADGVVLTSSATDSDGRAKDLLPEDADPGVYRLTFDTGHWFDSVGVVGFYPEVTISFTIVDPTIHHHVPLLLSPFAFSTYRGS
ncbi:5-hydroxyisourate hydrolase [Rhodococcoides trifolii]|uniref:5-hydroxyisourate hydrolase n=1 Tax=Rhodococcoides trifolii TaxID=908250 RepID=A0A917FXN6_9NOCA|nr:hydroxyisourate hydrolase [Rhodococcus trifolii]GGG12995.1 5-hydroxyisourate hydrolase [Rhodococcus trifolii]